MTKSQRSFARMMLFPIAAFAMMTAMMALAGTSHSEPAHAPVTSPAAP